MTEYRILTQNLGDGKYVTSLENLRAIPVPVPERFFTKFLDLMKDSILTLEQNSGGRLCESAYFSLPPEEELK